MWLKQDRERTTTATEAAGKVNIEPQRKFAQVTVKAGGLIKQQGDIDGFLINGR